MPLVTGSRLGPYEIQSALGAGGMGEVYKARATRLDRTVAVKILPQVLAADPQFRDRFDREARTISQLDHPHICALYQVGDLGDDRRPHRCRRAAGPRGCQTARRATVNDFLKEPGHSDSSPSGPDSDPFRLRELDGIARQSIASTTPSLH